MGVFSKEAIPLPGTSFPFHTFYGAKEGECDVQKQFLEIGQVVSTHGIKGEVRVKPYCDDAVLLTEFDHLYLNDSGSEEIKVLQARVQKNVVVMSLDGVFTVEQAQRLRGQMLYIHRDDLELEEGTYYIQDLIGLSVIDADEKHAYGTLIDVTQTGANDVYHIKGEDGKVVLVPAIRDVVIRTDIAEGVMEIRPLRGLFDDED